MVQSRRGRAKKWMIDYWRMQCPHGRVPPVIGFQNLPKKGEMDYCFNSIQEEFHANFSIFELVDEPQSRRLGKFSNKL